RRPRATPFPYTTLFRSEPAQVPDVPVPHVADTGWQGDQFVGHDFVKRLNAQQYIRVTIGQERVIARQAFDVSRVGGDIGYFEFDALPGKIRARGGGLDADPPFCDLRVSGPCRPVIHSPDLRGTNPDIQAIAASQVVFQALFDVLQPARVQPRSACEIQVFGEAWGTMA